MRTPRVVVLPYDKAWKAGFEAVSDELVKVLGGLALRVEHVGSTSVEGLSAKPIIDIDVVIEHRDRLDEVIKKLASIGYVHEGDLGIEGREAFAYTGKLHLMRHHLYVCAKDSRELERHLRFREYLRTHPEAVRKYSEVKQTAAELFPNDIDKYIEYKTPCIAELYKACGLE